MLARRASTRVSRDTYETLWYRGRKERGNDGFVGKDILPNRFDSAHALLTHHHQCLKDKVIGTVPIFDLGGRRLLFYQVPHSVEKGADGINDK